MMVAWMTSLSLAAMYVYEVHAAKRSVLFAFVVIALSAILVISFLVRRWQRRQMIESFGVKVCRRCGANGPPHAMFCGKCGERVQG
jgi:hypothetical protein